MKKFIFYSILFLLIILIFNSASLMAADAPKIKPVSITADKVPSILMNIAGWFYRIVLAVAVFFVLVAAFTYLTGANNPENIKKAHKRLLYAVIAIAIAISAWGIVSIVGSVLQVRTETLIETDLPPPRDIDY